jgi:hypothetical protein
MSGRRIVRAAIREIKSEEQMQSQQQWDSRRAFPKPVKLSPKELSVEGQSRLASMSLPSGQADGAGRSLLLGQVRGPRSSYYFW